jgi:hypothetical protein
MGLAERRASKKFQNEDYPALKKAIDEAAGFEVPIEVDWGSLAVDEYGHLYQEAFTKVYFQPLTEAIQDICIDDMGKEALKEALSKIVICNKEGRYGKSAFSFTDGVLLFDHKAVTNIDDVQERRKHIVELLEKAL